MKLRIAMKVLFTKVELFLIRNNKKFVIDTDTGDSDKYYKEKKIVEFSKREELG